MSGILCAPSMPMLKCARPVTDYRFPFNHCLGGPQLDFVCSSAPFDVRCTPCCMGRPSKCRRVDETKKVTHWGFFCTTLSRAGVALDVVVRVRAEGEVARRDGHPPHADPDPGTERVALRPVLPQQHRLHAFGHVAKRQRGGVRERVSEPPHPLKVRRWAPRASKRLSGARERAACVRVTVRSARESPCGPAGVFTDLCIARMRRGQRLLRGFAACRGFLAVYGRL